MKFTQPLVALLAFVAVVFMCTSCTSKRWNRYYNKRYPAAFVTNESIPNATKVLKGVVHLAGHYVDVIDYKKGIIVTKSRLLVRSELLDEPVGSTYGQVKLFVYNHKGVTKLLVYCTMEIIMPDSLKVLTTITPAQGHPFPWGLRKAIGNTGKFRLIHFYKEKD